MLDKTTVYILAEGMYFLDERPSNFNFFDFKRLVSSSSNSSCDLWNQESAFVYNLHHFVMP